MSDLERMAREAGFVLTPVGYLGGPIDGIEQLASLIRDDEAKKAAQLREWAKLAFRVINNVAEPLARLAEYSESTEESELTAALAAMASNVAYQYPAILGVNYIDAIKGARTAVEPAVRSEG